MEGNIIFFKTTLYMKIKLAFLDYGNYFYINKEKYKFLFKKRFIMGNVYNLFGVILLPILILEIIISAFISKFVIYFIPEKDRDNKEILLIMFITFLINIIFISICIALRILIAKDDNTIKIEDRELIYFERDKIIYKLDFYKNKVEIKKDKLFFEINGKEYNKILYWLSFRNIRKLKKILKNKRADVK